MKPAIILLAAVTLAGCVHPGYFYEKQSGKRVDADPVTLAKFEEHKLQCDAEASKAALASNEKDRFLHNRLVTTIYHACMAKRGYIVRDA